MQQISRSGQTHDPSSVHPACQPAIIEAIDRAQFGVIITTPAEPPRFLNAYARRVVDRRDGLTVAASGLEALRAADTRALRAAIEHACRRELAACATFMLPRASDRRPFAVHVPSPQYGGVADGLATVFVCDPHEEVAITEASLVRLYALTRAEATLAMLLASGQTVEQAADRLCVSVHTARTHLKRILMKTDTGRQAELLRLLLTCAAQVRID
jgi:DNA-binding CsgD family transcriptional regulator